VTETNQAARPSAHQAAALVLGRVDVHLLVLPAGRVHTGGTHRRYTGGTYWGLTGVDGSNYCKLQYNFSIQHRHCAATCAVLHLHHKEAFARQHPSLPPLAAPHQTETHTPTPFAPRSLSPHEVVEHEVGAGHWGDDGADGAEGLWVGEGSGGLR
jgi:hypothetical protein